MKLIIIEDEKLTAKDLKRTILGVDPDAEIVALLHSVEDALAFFATPQEADLIFSDIQLGDGLSFEIFKKTDLRIPIIFCTAYDNYLLEAFQTNGIDYLLKPFSKNDVEKALLKFEQLRQRFAAPKPIIQHALDAVEQSLRPQQQAIIVRHRDKIIPLEKASIALFYTANGINYALTFDQQKFVVNEHLEQLEQAFAPVFFRANRQFLINRKAVKDAAQHYNRKLQINLNIPFEEEILVGKLKISAFMEWLAHGLV